jgi:hypothetical protein
MNGLCPKNRPEQRHSSEKIEKLLGQVIGWFRQYEDLEQLRGLFAELIGEALAGLGMKGPVSGDLLEMKTNLSRLGETWKQKWLAEGRAEGRSPAAKPNKPARNDATISSSPCSAWG